MDDELLIEIVLRQSRKSPSARELREGLRKGENIYQETLDRGFRFTSIFDGDYPDKLRRLRYPPVVINYAGELSFCNDRVTVTLAGTRHPTKHGYNISMRLAELFGARDCVVVAGLAGGCGTAIHLGCLKALGKTVAIVGHGLDYVYPRENAPLADRIIESGGAIVSARFLHEKPRAEFFVERNFLQGGIADFLAITQTRPNSGTRHIVEAAKQCGNNIYVYDPPRDYDDGSFDENKLLIQRGVGIGLSSAADIDNCLKGHRL